MTVNRPPQVATAERSDGARDHDTPDAGQLRAILIAVSIALMAVIASVSGLNVAWPAARSRC